MSYAQAKLPFAQKCYELDGIVLFGYIVADGIVSIDANSTYWKACGVAQ